MIRSKSHLQKINSILDLLTEVNRILEHPTTQADRLQKMQFERQKQQYLSQLTDLLGTSTKPLTITFKRVSKAA